jgi:hypothetical protein
MPLRLRPEESVFVVFRPVTAALDPVVTLKRDGAEVHETVLANEDGTLHLRTRLNGMYQASTLSGRVLRADVKDAGREIAVAGPWRVGFEVERGGPPELLMERLVSWPEHGEAALKYYSGKGTYRTEVEIGPEWIGPRVRLYLALGEVADLASVRVNGQEMGWAWTAHNEVEITSAVRPGKNQVEVVVGNDIHNRRVGDAQVECAAYAEALRDPFTVTPAWLLEGRPSPGGRHIFTAKKPLSANTPLMPAGLLGPVRVVTEQVRELASEGTRR